MYNFFPDIIISSTATVGAIATTSTLIELSTQFCLLIINKFQFGNERFSYKGVGGNVTFSVKKIRGSHTWRNFEDNDLIFFLNSQN